MAFAVRRPGGRWEIRESTVTEAGPRARTLASFRLLTPDIATVAAARASIEVTPDEISAIAARAGAPLAMTRAEQIAHELQELLDKGAVLPVHLRHQLNDHLSGVSERADPESATGSPAIAGVKSHRSPRRSPTTVAVGRNSESDIESRVVTAAIDCLRRSGVRGTTMSDIAEHAGIARPNLYRYFPSRRALILRAVVTETRSTHPARRRRLAISGHSRELLVDTLMLGYETAMGDEFLQALISDAKIVVDLMRGDSDVLSVELEYWGPVFAHCRRRGELRRDLDDESIMRWLLFFQFTCLERSEYFTSEVYRAHLRAFVIPALLHGPSPRVRLGVDDTLRKDVSAV